MVLAVLAAFAAGLLIRLVGLTRVPLSDGEASLALQALDLARGQLPATVTQPAYLSLTALVFFLFGSSDFLARFWPALAGSLLVLAPLLYRRYLSPLAAVILAWLLALDPALVSASRTAGGPAFAAAFLLLSLGFYLQRRPAWAGICAALALLGGPQLWPGLVVLAVLLVRASGQVANVETENSQPAPFEFRTALVAFVLALLAAGTLFFRYPAVLSGIPSSVVAYLRGWTAPSGVPFWLPLFALFFYELLFLLGGLIGLVQDGVRRSLSLPGLAALLAVLLVVIYPARQVYDLVWVTIPLAFLTARVLARWLIPEEIALFPIAAEALLTVVLLGFAWLNLSALANPTIDDTTLLAAKLWSAVGLLLITSVLMVWGWSLAVMRTGLTYGLTLLLVLFTLSGAVNAAGLGRNPQAEMWPGAQPVMDEDLLRQTVGDLALWTRGDRSVIDVSVVGIDSPSLRWALRDVRQLSFVNYLPQTTQPAIVITPDQQTINISNSYRGQDFVWTRGPAWTVFLDAEWLRWFMQRQSPTEKTTLILWARTDLFPGGAIQPAPATP